MVDLMYSTAKITSENSVYDERISESVVDLYANKTADDEDEDGNEEHEASKGESSPPGNSSKSKAEGATSSNEKLNDLKTVMERECTLYSSVTLNSAFKSFQTEPEKDMIFNQLVEISNKTNDLYKENTYQQNSLEKLFLTYNILDKLPIQVSFLKHLKVLDLNHNDFHEIPFKFLPISLSILEIANNSLDKPIALSTSKANELVNLKYLNVNDNNFTSVNQMTNILKLPNLKIVDVNNIPDMDLLPIVSRDFLTNLRSYVSNSGNINSSGAVINNNNNHSRYNEYFKRLSVLPEDLNEDTPNEGSYNNNSGNLNGIITKSKTSLFKKGSSNGQQSMLSQEIGRSRTPTHMETANNASQSMFGSVVRSRTSSVSDNSGSNSANIKKNILVMSSSENTSVLTVKKNNPKSKSRKNSISNINAVNSSSTSNINQFGYQRISSFSSDHKSNLLEDNKKIDKENIRVDYTNITKESYIQARKKSQIIKYDKLLICCRRLLFTFTESQQTLRRVSQFGKDKTIAMNVVQLLYSTSHAIDNLVEVLEKCEEEESLNSANDNNKKILIKTCQDIFPFFKQIFKLLKNNFNSFFQNVELCFLRMFYMNLMNSYTELYNAYMIIKHKSDNYDSPENIKRGGSVSKVEFNEQESVDNATMNNNEETVIINSLKSNGKSPITASSIQNLETSSISSSHSSGHQLSSTSQPPVVTPTLISPPNVSTFKRSRSNTFNQVSESIVSPIMQSSINSALSTASSTVNLNNSVLLQPQPIATKKHILTDDQKLLQSLKSLNFMISQGIVDKIDRIITTEAFPKLSQSCSNCKKIDLLLSLELQNIDLENIESNKIKIWELMSQQIKAVLLFLGSVKQNLNDLTIFVNDEQNKDAFSQELSSLARLTKEITMLLDKSSFKPT